ncbi:MAG: SprT-like domain-containing protein [Candidatus Heimdallarchaeota archaeon]
MRTMKSRLLLIRNSAEGAIAKAESIYEAMLGNSNNISQGNFTKIEVTDLEILFALYDELFFFGLLQELLRKEKRGKLNFRLSKRMTRAGGKTTRIHRGKHKARIPCEIPVYEIAISVPLLFQSFTDVKRPITINGRVCKDRLEALQRIFEHELIHILELLLWGKSSCFQPNFRSLVQQIFAHTDVTHQMVTQSERALVNFGIKIGDRVRFQDDGEELSGFVNRITKRATILVKNEKGIPYSDGKRYVKYYVPISRLRISKSTK